MSNCVFEFPKLLFLMALRLKKMSACRPWIIMYKNISKSTYFNLWMSQLSQFLPMGYFFFSASNLDWVQIFLLWD